MYLVDRTFNSEIEIKKSTFIGFITSYNNFKKLREELKISHPKARHIVYAFRYLNQYNQIVEDLSDDGEPKGSSAPPILNIMRGENIINSAILVVRYFGGIKLGIGGLVRAYGNIAKEVIKSAELIEYVEKFPFSFESNYSLIGRYEHFLKSLDVEYEREFLSSKVIWKLSFSREEREKFLKFHKKFGGEE